MNITNAYYLVPRDDSGKIISGADAIGIKAIVDGVPSHVPLDDANTTYTEIQKQIAAGTLTIGSASDYDAVIAAELEADGHSD